MIIHDYSLITLEITSVIFIHCVEEEGPRVTCSGCHMHQAHQWP